jgi:hypothetical protein
LGRRLGKAKVKSKRGDFAFYLLASIPLLPIPNIKAKIP